MPLCIWPITLLTNRMELFYLRSPPVQTRVIWRMQWTGNDVFGYLAHHSPLEMANTLLVLLHGFSKLLSDQSSGLQNCLRCMLLRLPVSCFQASCVLMDSLVLKHGVMIKLWLAQNSNNQSTTLVQMRVAVAPDHVPPCISVVAHEGVEVSQ